MAQHAVIGARLLQKLLFVSIYFRVVFCANAWNLEVNPRSSCILLGNSASINCLNITTNGFARFPTNIRWFKILNDGGLLLILNSAESRVRSDGHQLRFYTTVASDTGLYCCKSLLSSLNERCSASETSVLSIALPPSISSPINKTVLTGETIYLNCTLTDVGEPAVSMMFWQTFGKTISEGSKHTIIHTDNSINLLITNVTIEDEGFYSCIAQNTKYQQDNKTMYLSVKSKLPGARDDGEDCYSNELYNITLGIQPSTGDCSILQGKVALDIINQFFIALCNCTDGYCIEVNSSQCMLGSTTATFVINLKGEIAMSLHQQAYSMLLKGQQQVETEGIVYNIFIVCVNNEVCEEEITVSDVNISNGSESKTSMEIIIIIASSAPLLLIIVLVIAVFCSYKHQNHRYTVKRNPSTAMQSTDTTLTPNGLEVTNSNRVTERQVITEVCSNNSSSMALHSNSVRHHYETVAESSPPGLPHLSIHQSKDSACFKELSPTSPPNCNVFMNQSMASNTNELLTPVGHSEMNQVLLFNPTNSSTNGCNSVVTNRNTTTQTDSSEKHHPLPVGLAEHSEDNNCSTAIVEFGSHNLSLLVAPNECVSHPTIHDQNNTAKHFDPPYIDISQLPGIIDPNQNHCLTTNASYTSNMVQIRSSQSQTDKQTSSNQHVTKSDSCNFPTATIGECRHNSAPQSISLPHKNGCVSFTTAINYMPEHSCEGNTTLHFSNKEVDKQCMHAEDTTIMQESPDIEWKENVSYVSLGTGVKKGADIYESLTEAHSEHQHQSPAYQFENNTVHCQPDKSWKADTSLPVMGQADLHSTNLIQNSSRSFEIENLTSCFTSNPIPFLAYNTASNTNSNAVQTFDETIV